MKIKFGLSAIAFDIQDFIKQGVAAEQGGFDSIWIADHFTDLPPSNDKYEPWTILATIGAKTEQIQLGTLATDCIRRHPAAIAHVLATLDNLTHGRAILGIGAGEAMNIAPYGLPWEDPMMRTNRLQESVMIIRMLWKSTQADPVNFRGHFYNLENARLDLHPQKDRNLPIYIASLGSKLSLQLTGKIGDGWLPWFNTPETFKERSSVIDRAAKKAGRTPQEIEKSAVVYLAATSNRDRQKQILDSMKQEVVVLTSSTRLAKLGHRISAQPSENYAYQKCLASSEDTIRAQKLGMELPDTVAERFLVTGTTDDCITQLKQLVAAGATHLIIRDMLWANQLEQFKVTLNLIANEVIPAFN